MMKNDIYKQAKRTLMVLTAWLLCATMHAREISDTLVIEGPDRVRIETRDTVQRIVISGSKEDPYLHYIQRISIPDTTAVRRKLQSIKEFNRVDITPKNSKRHVLSLGFHVNVGLNMMLNTPDGYDFRLWPSFETGIGTTLDWKPFGRRNVWSTGFGVGWRYYRMKANGYWYKDASGCMTMLPYADGMSDKQTSLSVFSLQIPLLYTHKFDDHDDWAVTLGAMFNINTGAHATRQFTLEKEDYSIETGSIGQRPLTVDAMLIIDTPGMFSIYCKYSPTTFFKNNCGPKMHQLTFGIYL